MVDVHREVKFFGKFQKNGGREGVGFGGGGQDACERRIKLFL